MSFMDLAAKRYSVRKFTDEKIDGAVVRQILDAGHLAPTACNNQPQKVIVVETEDALTKLRRCTSSHFNCPLAYIVCFDTERTWKRPYDGQDSGYVDASIVATHMMLEAAELGIGSTWVMYFIPEAVREEFNLPDNVVPAAILVMGKPAPEAAPSDRHTKYRAKDNIEVNGTF